MITQPQLTLNSAVALVSAAQPKPPSEERSLQVHQDTVRSTFEFLKSTSTFAELILRGIPLQSGGRLVPLCQLHLQDDPLIALLAKWRSDNADAFPTRFAVTYQGTARWLSHGVLDNPGRLTFLVLNPLGHPIGHLGLANTLNPDRSMEIDNVVRGEKSGDPGLMGEALSALLQWTYDSFTPTELCLRVFEDNLHAVQFYLRAGFRAAHKIGLKKLETSSSVSFEPASDGEAVDRYFLVMRHEPDASHVGESLILTAGPSISAREISYVNAAATSGWNRNWNRYIAEFEARFAAYTGRRYAIATSSCTGALHLALLAAGIGPGDEVIVPELTWVASANAVVYAGATPVFCDVDPHTMCMDPQAMKRKIGPKTRAVMPVHLYGHPAEMHRIVPIARAHGLKIIEDAAPAIGAECLGQRAGSFGDLACFSFQGAKLLVTGEGGILVTDDPELYARASAIADQGRDPAKTFWINQLGWKYKMSNVQAALGLAQLERVEELVDRKRRIFDWYEQELNGVEGIELCREAAYARSIYWMSSILVKTDCVLNRSQLIGALKARNVDTRPVFPAISQYPHWEVRQTPEPVALALGDSGINLPSGVLLTQAEVRYCCEQIKESLREHGRRAA